MIKKKGLDGKYERVKISIPQTIVLCTDVFDEFMRSNSLYEMAFSDSFTDEQILQSFLDAELPLGIVEDLRVIVSVISKPPWMLNRLSMKMNIYVMFVLNIRVTSLWMVGKE